ncbi:hypothetical protein DIE07_04580 [Burkholderia sp. Bp9002]|nr:hypothetical protein DIE07_04580 [Burkholderia sp. Bp9002]
MPDAHRAAFLAFEDGGCIRARMGRRMHGSGCRSPCIEDRVRADGRPDRGNFPEQIERQGCHHIGNIESMSTTRRWNVTNTMRSLIVLAGAVLCCVPTDATAGDASQPRRFLTFSSRLSDAWIMKHGSEYVFVWGESDGNKRDPVRADVWKQYAPNTELSTYFPYGRDPARADPASWQKSHPDWIAYRCDGETMAELFDKPIVPLDISNPQVVAWQVGNFVNGQYRDIALDNFSTSNVERECGVKRNGRFVRQYTEDRAGTERFAEAKVAWLERVTAQLHEAGKTVTVNYQIDRPVDSPLVRRITKAVDSVLTEEMFPPRHKGRFKAILDYADRLKREGKGFYAIYEIEVPSADTVQSVMAAYLIYAWSRSAVSISAVQDYGSEPKYGGFDRSVGTPCEEYRNSGGIYSRRYAGGVTVFADPMSPVAAVYRVPPGFSDVSGKPAPSALELKPGEGRILYRTGVMTCS